MDLTQLLSKPIGTPYWRFAMKLSRHWRQPARRKQSAEAWRHSFVWPLPNRSFLCWNGIAISYAICLSFPTWYWRSLPPATATRGWRSPSTALRARSANVAGTIRSTSEKIKHIRRCANDVALCCRRSRLRPARDNDGAKPRLRQNDLKGHSFSSVSYTHLRAHET